MEKNKSSNDGAFLFVIGLIIVIAVAAIVLLVVASTAENRTVDPEEIAANLPDLSGTPEDICAAAPKDTPTTRSYSGAEDVLQDGVDYRAIFCTEAGPVYVDLFEKATPITVNNFVFLAQRGYYNNTTFHRVLEGFMAQGGDPEGTGRGGPGYQFQDEFVSYITFDRIGLLAMANGNSRDQGIFGTNGSQFFITTGTAEHLNNNHTIFGEVLTGQSNVEALELRDPQTSPDFAGSKLDTVVIITDPSKVEADVPADRLEPASEDTVESAFNIMRDVVAAQTSYPLNEDAAGTLTTDEVVAAAPADAQEDFEAVLAEFNHQYRIVQEWDNPTCDERQLIHRFGYQVDAFDSEADATSALADARLYSEQIAAGLTEMYPVNDAMLALFMGDAFGCTPSAPDESTDADVETTPEPDMEATAEPDVEMTAEPGVEATDEPAADMEATDEPDMEMTAEPGVEATDEPAADMEVTAEPDVEMTAEPIVEATDEPAADMEATAEPDMEMTAEPDVEVTAEPTPELPDTESASVIVAYYQHGRYVVQMQMVFVPDLIPPQFTFDDAIDQLTRSLMQLFESTLGEVYLPEIR